MSRRRALEHNDHAAACPGATDAFTHRRPDNTAATNDTAGGTTDGTMRSQKDLGRSAMLCHRIAATLAAPAPCGFRTNNSLYAMLMP